MTKTLKKLDILKALHQALRAQLKDREKLTGKLVNEICTGCAGCPRAGKLLGLLQGGEEG